MFCFWAVAKPNYYLPCLPGMALLIGATWVHLARAGRGLAAMRWQPGGSCRRNGFCSSSRRWWLRSCVRRWLPEALWPWSLAIGLSLAVAVVVSVYAWRRGADCVALAPIAAACVLGVLVAYGMIAPAENAQRSHRDLAQRLGSIVPPTSAR